MEKEDNNAATITTPVLVKEQKKKKRSLLSVIRATLIAIRCRRCRSPGKKSIESADTANHGALNRLVSCMRPLHLQPDEYREPLPILPPPPPNGHDSFHDVCLSPPSPACSSGYRTSHFASAENLVGLDGATTDGEGCEEEGGESKSIDVRAEEFIMTFYEQMRLQRSDSLLGYAVIDYEY